VFLLSSFCPCWNKYFESTIWSIAIVPSPFPAIVEFSGKKDKINGIQQQDLIAIPQNRINLNMNTASNAVASKTYFRYYGEGFRINNYDQIV
jgi:hypothetical protein